MVAVSELVSGLDALEAAYTDVVTHRTTRMEPNSELLNWLADL